MPLSTPPNTLEQTEAMISLPRSPRKQQYLDATEQTSRSRDAWIAKNRYFHAEDEQYLRFLIPPGQRVLEVGCGAGHSLAAVHPSVGVGVDFSPARIAEARQLHPELTFLVGDAEDPTTVDALVAKGPFDVVLIVDLFGYLDDIQQTIESLHRVCHADTRIVLAYHSYLWEPILRLAESAGMKEALGPLNYVAPADISNILSLAGFEVVKQEARQLIPRYALGIGKLINRWIAPLPGIRSLCIRRYAVARSRQVQRAPERSCSVIIPARNERGNIEAAVLRLPQFCPDLEIIFVEGHSKDATWEEILRVQAAYPDRKIRCLQQTGKGKGDAVRAGFAASSAEVLMILDADLTVAPEDLPKFFRAMTSDVGEFINGTRLIYPLQEQAMRFLNYWANRTFAVLFSYLLNQRLSDTLCGTKVLRRSAYEKIVRNRSYFGDFDPFGDFDLIFGAARINLKIVEVPVRYAARTYGTTQISRFSHGWLLLRMVAFAFRKIKAL